MENGETGEMIKRLSAEQLLMPVEFIHICLYNKNRTEATLMC